MTVQSLVQEMDEKYGALMCAWSTLSITEPALAEANQELESSHKMVKELELSLSEAREGYNKVEDGLREIRHENLELSKEYVKLVEDNFSIMHVFF